MILRDIYNTAMALLSEETDSKDNADLEERSQALLPAVISSLYRLERQLQGTDIQSIPCNGELDNAFPLSDRLATLCAYKLAYLLISDENAPLCSLMKTEYENEYASIISSLPAACTPIKDIYR